jgi:glycosyltransferase involved in cell wall biosynthesis
MSTEQAVRVVYIAREVPRSESATTGAERRTAEYIEELERAGVPALAFLAPGGAATAEREPARGRALWRHLPEPIRGARRDLLRLAGAARFVLANLRTARRFRPTVVLERAAYLDPSGALLARLLNVPHVLELHGDLAADMQSYYHSPFERMGSAYERRRYRVAARTIVVSQGLADMLRSANVSAERVAVVANGVTALRQQPDPQPVRASWNVEGRKVVGWIGHLMPWQSKDFVRLAEDLNDVNERIPLALVLVAPETAAAARTLEELTAAARYPVVAAGGLGAQDADDAVAAFDVGIIPAARPYDLPVKLFHYGLLEVPVVAPATVSTMAFDRGRELLYLFEPGRAGEAVERALSDPDRSTRTERLRQIVASEHSWSAVVEGVIAVCRTAYAGDA